MTNTEMKRTRNQKPPSRAGDITVNQRNEQKKIILLDAFVDLIEGSSLAQDTKDDLTWTINELGPAFIEVALDVADAGTSAFKKVGWCCCK